ncbi:uncharacterized protein LOC124344521 isoform X2 [Daphnia pulicaria]|uniref:uncharacterized protein LOC124344521 isoform X2 n=1 Tax=Daphnia pulicaria TaxID=35523 RepID=UPI001EEBF053|nr:uncharacterized protein LOC124344521 isoform X2 [Daphnia pulicaria]
MSVFDLSDYEDERLKERTGKIDFKDLKDCKKCGNLIYPWNSHDCSLTDADEPELDEDADELELGVAEDKPAFDEVQVVKHDAAVAKVDDDLKLSEADDELGEEDKPAFGEVQVVKHEVAVVAATPPLVDQAANPSGRNECSLERRKKSLHLLKIAKKQRKEEKAKNLAD